MDITFDMAEPSDRLEQVGRLRLALDGLMDIESYAWGERGNLTLRGQLTGPSQALYRTIRTRMESLGYTPFLRRSGERDELLATPGVIERRVSRVVVPVLLFLATFLTVLMTGAVQEGVDIVRNPSGILVGLPFALTLLGILGTHEMGHYVVGKLRRAPVSLPYFIPMPPFISFTGTMGAVIVQREPMEDRRTILEVGIAGPIAGLVVAIPLLFYGLSTSKIGPPPIGAEFERGNSLLYILAKLVVFGRNLPDHGQDVQLNAVATAAWIGLLVTMLNLLPVGQLDGGHVAYALLGRYSSYLAYGMIALCLVLGITVSASWLIWAVLAFLVGPRHPAPLNDIARIDPPHVALALFGLLLFVLLLTPAPLTPIGG